MTKKTRRRTRPEVEEILEVTLGDPAHGGACVARAEDGRVVFVRLGLPGERVRARVTSRQSRLSWADVIEVLTPSPDRIPNAEEIPGADLYMATPVAQRDWKTRALQVQLRRVGGPELAQQVADVVGEAGLQVQPLPGDTDPADPLLGRRTRSRFVVDRQGKLAMRDYRSHDLRQITNYPLLDPRFAAAGVFTDDRWTQVWKAGDRVTLVAAPEGDALVVVGDKAWNLEGAQVEPRLQWDAGTAGTFNVTANGFWQVHKEAPETLAAAVMRAAGDLEGQNVLELYSGAGLLTYSLANAVGPQGHVMTVEISESAVADAAANLESVNADERVDFFVGKVDAEAIAKFDLGDGLDAVILDPPREGAGREVVDAIVKSHAKRVVLVSCDPAAGARDLGSLVAAGFRLDTIEAFDFFPHTHHFEIVSSLVR